MILSIMILAYQKNSNILCSAWVFMLFVLLLSMVTIFVLENNYLNESALMRWSMVLSVFEAEEVRLENIGLMHPHIPVFLLIPFYYLFGTSTAAAPYFLSVITGAGLLLLWNTQLVYAKYSRNMRIILILLVIANPVFLWAVTSGSEKALSLLMYYIICYAILRIVLKSDTRGIIILAGSLAIYLFVDAHAFFMVVSIIPFIPMIASPGMLKASPVSVFVLIMLPAFFAISSWFYLNWVFYNDALNFLTVPNSSFLGARLTSGDSLWLVHNGGSVLWVSIITILGTVMLFPTIAWQSYAVWQSKKLRRAIRVFFFIPVVAAILSTSTYMLSHPVEVIFLITSVMMVGMLVMPRRDPGKRKVAILLVLAGNVVATGLFFWNPTPDMYGWRQAATGQDIKTEFAEELKLGVWLAAQDRETLIDERSSYHVISSRGHIDNLLLSYMPEFKVALKYGVPNVEQIVVMNPKQKFAYLDRITQRYPKLFIDGMSGYYPVYESYNWKVYRKIHR